MKHLLRRAAALFLAIALCAPLFATPAAAADDMARRQKAIVETAAAYYLKGALAQYDSQNFNEINRWDGGDLRQMSYAAPETATADQNLYMVCNSFVFEVYNNAIGYQICGDPRASARHYMEVDGAARVFHYDKGGDVSPEDAVRQARAALQPGDYIAGYRSSDDETGHVMLYVGDILGDGTKYIMHSDGHKYDMEARRDNVEPNGTLHLESAESFLFDLATAKTNWCLGKAWSFSIIRPLNAATSAEYPLTAAAEGRLKYPRMRIDRTVTGGICASAEAGENLCCTIEISNHSTAAYRGLTVTEKLPDGTKFVSCEGRGTAADGGITWNLTIPAGETVTVSYTVAVTAARGASVTFDGGAVGGIPSNRVTVTVCGKKLPAMTAQEICGASAKAPLTTDFAADVYAAAFGAELRLPAVGKLARMLFDSTQWNGKGARYLVPKTAFTAADEPAASMLVPQYFGGTLVQTGVNRTRVHELRASHLQCGDVFVLADNPFGGKNGNVLVCVAGSDGKLVTAQDGKAVIASDKLLENALGWEFFVLLRPTLAYDDVANDLRKLPFADVAASDWYYAYVRDLVADGTVSGMTETAFKPAGTVTYGQALKLIALAAGEAEQKATGANWASGYLALAQSKGWLAGTPNLDGNISRLALCQIAAKALGLTEQPAANPFTDTADGSVLALNKAGVINGMTDTTFAPDKTLTRAQISKIIWCMENLK